MSEEIKDAREVSPDLMDSLKQRKTPGFGPGYVNLAIPDRGHMGSCVAMEFDDAGKYNAYCAAHSDWLTVYLGVRGDKVFVVFQVLKSELEVEEMQMVSRKTEEFMAEFRAKRKEQEERDAQAKREKEEADTELSRIGRFCVEAHGTFVKDLPGLSKLKAVRKGIADDIIKCFEDLLQTREPPAEMSFEEAEKDAAAQTKKLQKILEKYLKEGAK